MDIWGLTSRKRYAKIKIKYERMFDLYFKRVYIR